MASMENLADISEPQVSTKFGRTWGSEISAKFSISPSGFRRFTSNYATNGKLRLVLS